MEQRTKTTRHSSSPPLPLSTSPRPAGVTMAAAASGRRQHVILKQPTRPRARCAEVAGGTTAECVAVCCCFPCVLVNVMVLTAVKLPAGLCRRAKRKEQIRKRREEEKEKDEGGKGEGLRGSEAPTAASAREPRPAAGTPPTEDAEEDMWPNFYNTGFWRSPSEGDDRS